MIRKALIYKYLLILRYVTYLAWCRNKTRFIKTKLGSIWIGLSTLLMISSLAFVYGAVVRVANIREYIAYIGLGILFWNTSAGLVTDFSTLLNRSRDRLLSTSINIIDIMAEEYIFALQNLFFSMCMVLPAIALIYPSIIPKIFTIKALIAFATYLIVILINSISIAIISLISADLFQLIPVALQLSFLLSPILYYKESLKGKEWVFRFNPFYIPVTIARDGIYNSGAFSYKKIILLLFLSLIIFTFLIKAIKKNARKINLYVDR